MKLNKKLSQKTFVLTNIFVLIFGLIFLSGLYYILKIQYSASQKPFEGGLVISLPKTLRLELEQPEDNLASYNSSILISGKTSPNLEVLIFSGSKDKVFKSKSDGSFSIVFDLTKGVNLIKVVVFDSNGDSKTEERTIYYSKEKI